MKRHETQSGWYELRCPDCNWNHTLWMTGGAEIVQCPHCHKYFAVRSLQRLRSFLGGIRQLTAEESYRMDKWALMQTLREQADEIAQELQKIRERSV